MTPPIMGQTCQLLSCKVPAQEGKKAPKSKNPSPLKLPIYRHGDLFIPLELCTHEAEDVAEQFHCC